MNTGKTILAVAAITTVAVSSYMIAGDDGDATPISPVVQSVADKQTSSKDPDSDGNFDDPVGEIDIEAETLADLEKLSLTQDIEKEIAELEQDLEQIGHETPASPWIISPVISENAIELDAKIQTREPVSIDTAQAADVAVGDIIALPLPGTEMYQAVVDRVSVHNSETSWTGYLQGYDTDYPVVFTIGAQSSFATITTPEGLYAMESFNGNGWVYKTPDLVDLVDPDQPDHLIIDRDDHIE